jgi:hypothetical protein
MPARENTERLKIDEQKYPLSSEISILGDLVKISIFGQKLSGISIRSRDLAQTLKSLIDYIFDQRTKN